MLLTHTNSNSGILLKGFAELRPFCLQDWTEKLIRKELEKQLSIDLSEKKHFIRDKVRLAHPELML